MSFIINPYSFGFNPLSLSPALWLSDTGSDPATWPDLSGNGRNATQATSGGQPAIVTNAINGRQVRRFDGVNDGLFRLTSDSGMITNARSIFIVSNQSSSGSERCQFDVGNWLALTQNGTAGKWYGAAARSFTAISSGTWWVASVVETIGSTSIARVNGGADITLASPTSLTGNGAFSVGSVLTGGFYFGGDIAEILIYPTALSTTNRQAVESYLRTKWGTP